MTSAISLNDTQKNITISPTVAINRLTALWALHEAGLGGLLHILNTPFSGLLMAGIATILISLIAHFANRKYSIVLKSLFLVLIAKIIVSPHAGFPAYLAVLVQGFLGAVIFKYIRSLRIAAILLGALALLESAIQKVLLMVLMFGKSLFDSIDIFIHQLSRSFNTDIPNGSFWVIVIYLAIYIFVGILAGNFVYLLVKNINSTLFDEYQETKIDDNFIMVQQYYIEDGVVRKPKKHKISSDIIFVTVAIFIIFTFILPTSDGWKQGIYAFLRAAIFVILWFFVLNPLLTSLFKYYFSKKHSKYQAEMDDIFDFMNTLRKLVGIAWNETSQHKGFKRLSAFLTKSVVYTLLYEK